MAAKHKCTIFWGVFIDISILNLNFEHFDQLLKEHLNLHYLNFHETSQTFNEDCLMTLGNYKKHNLKTQTKCLLVGRFWRIICSFFFFVHNPIKKGLWIPDGVTPSPFTSHLLAALPSNHITINSNWFSVTANPAQDKKNLENKMIISLENQ